MIKSIDKITKNGRTGLLLTTIEFLCFLFIPNYYKNLQKVLNLQADSNMHKLNIKAFRYGRTETYKL